MRCPQMRTPPNYDIRRFLLAVANLLLICAKASQLTGYPRKRRGARGGFLRA